MRGAIPPLTHTPSWRGAQLKGKEAVLYTNRQESNGRIFTLKVSFFFFCISC